MSMVVMFVFIFVRLGQEDCETLALKRLALNPGEGALLVHCFFRRQSACCARSAWTGYWPCELVGNEDKQDGQLTGRLRVRCDSEDITR